ncbi:MAG: DNA recombination protein RmuC [Bacteroidetes bacterium]|nr:DNA recombination protein RmuC [Bacteroidota bacterium]
MNEIVLYIILILLVAVGVMLIVMLTKKSSQDPLLNQKLDSLDLRVSQEFSNNRQEQTKSLQSTREEVGNLFGNLSTGLFEKLKTSQDESRELGKSLNELVRQRLDDLANRNELFRKDTEVKLKEMRDTLENKVSEMQKSNETRLEEMRKTVDEKLQKTLDERLAQSFKQVSDRLELVHKGLGEMQNLAQDVGGLKKVLSNVKTRGILGEIQLGNILENILAPSQYRANVRTKPGSAEVVEFVICLPGPGEGAEPVFLPVDSKFPMESYSKLVDAYENGDLPGIETAKKSLDSELKRCAKDIRDKYIHPPLTTDFGILFLPTEGLYAEIVRNSDLIETIQRDYKMVVTGPSTLAAFLNSLQMGFKTLSIQKQSAQIGELLKAVSREFQQFGGVLDKAQDRIRQAGEEIEKLVGTRTRMIQRQLKKVDELPDTTVDKNMLLEDSDMEDGG